MEGLNVKERLQVLPARKQPHGYNFDHFSTGVLIEDGRKTLAAEGICPGEMAPDFELPAVGGGTIRLSALRGRPVLLHFGSYS